MRLTGFWLTAVIPRKRGRQQRINPGELGVNIQTKWNLTSHEITQADDCRIQPHELKLRVIAVSSRLAGLGAAFVCPFGARGARRVERLAIIQNHKCPFGTLAITKGR